MSHINVVGILKYIGNLDLINLVKSNDQVYKRVLQLMDEHKNNIHVTLWGKVAENWSYKKYDVLTFKSVGVNEYGGHFGIKVYALSIITKNDDNEKSERVILQLPAVSCHNP
uniref:Replication protein A OB domain-containing protein n=1 Tax=Trichogramma kaykai TaxID=54128 RepID=A0ABD2W5F8_9HYME